MKETSYSFQLNMADWAYDFISSPLKILFT